MLDEGQRHYLRDVMRRTVGDEVALFNGCDGEWSAEIVELSKKTASLRVQKQLRSQQIDPTSPCILCVALLKKDPMDLVLQKATEMGVSAIYPMITARTVVHQFNHHRAQALVREAAEQSERLDVPRVTEVASLKEVVASLPPQVQPVFLSERGCSEGEWDTNKATAYFVGPEGGFTDEEAGFLASLPLGGVCHLGKTILRAETAALAIIACHQFAREIKK